MDVDKVVLECLCTIAGRDDITPAMMLGEDVALTSVNAMKLAFDLENELNLDEIPQEVFFKAETVQDLIDEIKNLV